MLAPIARHPDAPKRWRVRMRNDELGINGVTERTYTFSDAYAMMAKWHPSVLRRCSLVPA